MNTGALQLDEKDVTQLPGWGEGRSALRRVLPPGLLSLPFSKGAVHMLDMVLIVLNFPPGADNLDEVCS